MVGRSTFAVWGLVSFVYASAPGCKAEPPTNAGVEARVPAAPAKTEEPVQEHEPTAETVDTRHDLHEAHAKAKEGVLKSYLLARTTMRYVDSGGEATLGGHGFSILGQEGGRPSTGPSLVERLAAEDERRRGKEASHRGMKDDQESP